MKEFRNEVWTLVGKCIAKEASSEELFLMQNLIEKNEELKTTYGQLQTVYNMRQNTEQKNSTTAFNKLDARIKSTNIA